MNNRKNRKQKKRQLAAGIIAIILALAMVLSLVMVTVSAQEVSGSADPAVTTAGTEGNEGTQDAAAETAGTDAGGENGTGDQEGSSSVLPRRLIGDGITLNGVNLAGKTRAEAQAIADSMVSNLKNAAITLRGNSDDQVVTVSAGNLGLTWTNPEVIDTIAEYGHAPNIIARYKQAKDKEVNGCSYEITVDFNKDQIRSFVENNCLVWNVAPVEASMSGYPGGFTYSEGSDGITLNEDESVDRIYDSLTQGWDGGNVSIDLVMETTSPKTTVADLQQLTSVLGTFTTYYATSNESRAKNIANACQMISGTVLQPGESFSVLSTITPFTEENGYELAGSYLGDEVVESFGGGICQVSTTLYNAVIRAELQVDERHNHSMAVEYVDRSADAAIAESAGMDFRFTNNLANPVYIVGATYTGSISFTIYGVETRPSDRTISFESETLSETPSEGTKVKTDASQPIGYVNTVAGHTGYTARLWKVVTVDGVQQSRDVFNNSTYLMTPTYVTVGTAGTMTDELQNAINSGDIDAIKTAAANAEAGVSETEEDDLTAQAKDAADAAYAEALAQGLDTTTAMQEAEAAANAVVNGAGTDSSDAGTDPAGTESSAGSTSTDGTVTTEGADGAAAAQTGDAGVSTGTDGTADAAAAVPAEASADPAAENAAADPGTAQ